MRAYGPMTKTAFILNFFKFYNTAWKLSLPFLRKNKRLRSDFEKRVTSFHHTKADLWVQAASAGEAYLAVTMIQTLSPLAPIKILATSTTSQGIDILNTLFSSEPISQFIDLTIEWFPFDIPSAIKDAVKIINPRVMVLLETEIWPGLLFYLKDNQTRILILNARLSKKSFNRYLKTNFLWKHLAPDLICATSDQDAKRYQQVFETSRVITMPNIKFESFKTQSPDALHTLDQIKNILPARLPLTILASVRRQEEKQVVMVLEEILLSFPNQVVAIFPRHLHRIRAWKKRLTSRNLNFSIRSQISSPLQTPGIILWDTFGELKAAYGAAKVVFVGGSLKPLGGQNFIEPAIQGAMTITGPHNDDFAWTTQDIFKKGIVLKKENWMAVSSALVMALKSPANRSDQKQKAQDFLLSNQGGTKQACDEILKAFDGLL